MIFSCGDHHYPKSLLSADSLTEVNPDSALALLRQLRPQMQHERKAVRMYHRLLTVKAADKADQLQPMPDSILPIVKYYEGKGDKRLLPTAYYYAGRTYYELHDAPQALDYFQKAAEVVRHEQANLRSAIYSQMGSLYLNQGLYDLADMSFKKEYELALNERDTLGMIYGMKDMAFVKEAEEDHVGALWYLNESYRLAQLRKDKLLAAGILQSLTVQHTILNNFQEAHKYGKLCLDNIALLDSNVVYYTMAKLYNREGINDSLLFYCNKLRNYSALHAQDSICRFLLKVSLNDGDIDQAQIFYHSFLSVDDSIKKQTEANAVMRVKTLYDYQQREKENVQLRQTNHKMWNTFFGIVVSFSIIILYLLYYTRQQKELRLRYMRSEQLREELLKQSQQSIAENEKHIVKLEALIRSFNKDADAAILQEQEFKKQRLLTETKIAKLKLVAHESADRSVSHSLICQKFLQTLNDEPVLQPTDSDWKELEDFLNETYDSFCLRLQGLCRMTTIKYRISLLIKIKMDTRIIAKIVNTSKPNVSTVRSRLYKDVFGKDGGASDWDNFIWSM